MASHRRSSKPRRDPFVLGIIGAMIGSVVLCLVMLWQIGKLDHRPQWWSVLENNPGHTEQVGIELENRITSALTRVRSDEERDWVAAIDQDQLNSWLTHRLRETISSFDQDAEVDRLGDIRVKLDPSGITAGAQIRHTHGSTIVWSIFDIGTDTQGRFVIRTRAVYVGGTRVPSRLAARYLTSERLGRASVDLGDGRRVRIRAIRPGEHRLELALRTELAE
ncbi:MAG: hypothetical protein JJ974_00135 [Phycisphaerales bacterium]|nr:hypothetical protein [Phycisphaerales bacterium]